MALTPLTPSFFALPPTGSWNNSIEPHQISNQHFGMGLVDSDLHPPMLYRGYKFRPRTQVNIDQSGKSEMKNELHKYQVMLNVDHFAPDEISVKTVDNSIVVHGKHEEKGDEHGFVSREFTRRYLLPEGIDPKAVVFSLSPNGVLTIEAPKIAVEVKPLNERAVPISTQEGLSEETK